MLVAYAPEGAIAALELLAPLAFACISFWPSRRGHWSGPLLAAPALLWALAFSWALAKNHGPGYMGWPLLIYIPLLWIFGIASVGLWLRRRHA